MSLTTTTPRHELPAEWRRALDAVARSPALLLHGLPGTGKSYAATVTLDHPAGSVAPDDILTLTLHEDAAASDIIGGFLPRHGKWDWRDGPAMLAWRLSHERPVRLVLNELDQAAGPVMTALYAVLDSPATARLTLPTGETLRPNPGNLQVIATMNGEPQDLIPALRDRLIPTARLDSPHPDSLASLNPAWQELAQGMSSASARNEKRGTTPREWHALAMLTDRGMSLDDAAALVWTEDRARDVLTHLKIAAAPSPVDAEADPDTYSDPETDPEYDHDDDPRVIAHRDAVSDGGRHQYECHSCESRFDTDEGPDSDGDVYCPNCESYTNHEEAERRAMQSYGDRI